MELRMNYRRADQRLFLLHRHALQRFASNGREHGPNLAAIRMAGSSDLLGGRTSHNRVDRICDERSCRKLAYPATFTIVYATISMKKIVDLLMGINIINAWNCRFQRACSQVASIKVSCWKKRYGRIYWNLRSHLRCILDSNVFTTPTLSFQQSILHRDIFGIFQDNI